MSAPKELEPGSTFADQFRIVRRLASGGMGAVYIAEQLATGRERALKLMHPGLINSPELREKFALEARVGARIASDHVVEVVGAGVDLASGAPWLAMELLVGEDLAHAIRRRGEFGLIETTAILAQVCHALGAAHASSIVHRDLKPENVFLARSQRAHESVAVKVLDFGIAKVIEVARGSNTGAIGSPLWMAPEQTERNTEISPATDVWALGLVAFTMLTGRSFWLSAEQTEMALSAFLRELVLDDLPLASARATELGVEAPLPPGFDAWFSRTLCRSRTARYPDATKAFAGFCQHLGIAAPSSTGPLPQVVTGPVRSERTLPESRTGTDRLASARTVPDPASGAGRQAAAPAANDEGEGEGEGEPSVVPVEGVPPRLFAIAAVVVAAIVTASAIVVIRGRTTEASLEPPDASAIPGSLPYCPKGMVRVPAGELVMGADDGPKEEQPAHAVKVNAFCIDATEVSASEMKECVVRKGCSASPREQVEWEGITAADRTTWSTFCNAGRTGRVDHPMNCVSFDDASAYCRWANKKLPTEEQWEYAARGSDGRTYPWGSDVPAARRVNGCDDGCARAIRRPADTIARRLSGDDHYEATSPTGALPEGVTAFGAFDMAGNVAEWVDAPFCSYGQSACGTATRVIRGGSWTSELPGDLRASARAKASPASRQADIGFRCVK